MQYIMVAFNYPTSIVLVSLESRVILNNLCGIKYHVFVQFPIDHVYNKDERILLNSLNFTLLSGLCY